jgi:prepilin-type N-terminal cleavage/methylation domain-containing protein
MSFLFSRKRGFSLAEITIAVAIVALLSSVVIANLQESRKKSRDVQRISDMQQIQLGLRAYRDANSSDYPASASGELITGTSGVGALIASFFPKTVVDPLNGTAGYGYYYDSAYNCGGSHVVLIASAMERTSASNFVSKCGSGTYETAGGMTPTASSYILILK